MLLSVAVHLHSLKWMIPTFIMLGNAPCYICIWSACRVLTAIFPRRYYRTIDDRCYGLYMKLLLFFFENYIGLKKQTESGEQGSLEINVGQHYVNTVCLYGEFESILGKEESVIYLSNHQCTVDWLVACMLSVRQGSVGHLRYIMKDGLKYFPLYGFYFVQHGNLFVKRSGKFKDTSLSKQLEFLKKNDLPVWLVVFPEGTRYNPELIDTVNSSKEFSKQKGLPALNNVLCPRARATHMSIEHLRGSIDTIYDVTIAYNNTYNAVTKERQPSPGLTELLTAVSPEVHVHIKKINIDLIPQEESKFKNWLHSRYIEKDRLLAHFYSDKEEENGRFPGKAFENNLNFSVTLPSFVFFGSLLACSLIIPQLRSAYWKIGVFGSLTGILWVSVRT